MLHGGLYDRLLTSSSNKLVGTSTQSSQSFSGLIFSFLSLSQFWDSSDVTSLFFSLFSRSFRRSDYLSFFLSYCNQLALVVITFLSLIVISLPQWQVVMLVVYGGQTHDLLVSNGQPVTLVEYRGQTHDLLVSNEQPFLLSQIHLSANFSLSLSS